MMAKLSPLPGSAYRAHPAEDRLVAAGSFGVVLAALAAVLAMALPGCSSSAAHSVEPDRARAAMSAALDAWKGGQTPQSFEESGAAKVVQDLDWLSGARLVDYRLLDDGVSADANLKISARLTLSNKGKQVEKEVRYLVTTSPSVTIFRDVMW